MRDLDLIEHLPMIKELVSKYMEAQIELVESNEAIDGKLGQSRWGHPTEIPLITLPRRITKQEIENSLLALIMRGHIDAKPELSSFASAVVDSVVYIKHLVLHEVAHAANNWPQSMETECDLWALAKLNQEQR